MATGLGGECNGTGMKRRRSWRGIVIEGLLLMGLWLHLSGHFDIMHLLLGMMSVLLVMFVNAPLKGMQLHQGDTFAWDQVRYGLLFAYVPWLGSQIFFSSPQVAYLVLHPKIPVAPYLVHFSVNLPNLTAKVMFGNSITLTPGTVTVRIRGNDFLVHALTREAAVSLVNGVMPMRVSRIFNGSVESVVSNVQIVKLDRAS